MNQTLFIIYQLLPEIVLFVMILVILLVTAFQVKPAVAANEATFSNSNQSPFFSYSNLGYLLTFATLLVTIFMVILPYFSVSGSFPFVFLDIPYQNYLILNGAIRDSVSDLFKLFILFTSLIALVTSRELMQSLKYACNEYWVIFLICILGMLVAVSATSLLLMFVGLEIMALSFYSLIALDKKNTNSVIAAMKYFVLGSLAAGLFLFGLSLIYGALGSFDLVSILKGTRKLAQILSQGIIPDSNIEQVRLYIEKTNLLLGVGLVFVISALAFKLGSVPFHLWIADVYDGAHTPIVTLIASASKIVVTAVIFRILIMGFYPYFKDWQILIMFLSVSSIILGNVAAISQQSVKRMLAYSAISHGGYLLLGFVSGTLDSVGAAMFYIFTYALVSACTFGLLASISHKKEQFDTLNSLKGLHSRKPIFALLLMILMLSMAGIPPFIGFYAKFGVIQPLISNGFFAIAIIAVVFSVVGAYYYLRVIKLMYFDAPKRTNPIRKISLDSLILLIIVVSIVVLLGLFPDGLLKITRYSLFLEQTLPTSVINF